MPFLLHLGRELGILTNVFVFSLSLLFLSEVVTLNIEAMVVLLSQFCLISKMIP